MQRRVTSYSMHINKLTLVYYWCFRLDAAASSLEYATYTVTSDNTAAHNTSPLMVTPLHSE